jgi:hypothetical protein
MCWRFGLKTMTIDGNYSRNWKGYYYSGDTIVELTDKVQIPGRWWKLSKFDFDGYLKLQNGFTTNTGMIKLVNKIEFEDLRTKFKTLLKWV